jgi:hypothetical protein
VVGEPVGDVGFCAENTRRREAEDSDDLLIPFIFSIRLFGWFS